MMKPLPRRMPKKMAGEVLTPHYFRGGMRKYFRKSDCSKFIDLLFVQMGKGCHLDIIAFDDWLHEQHGEYEDKLGLSMSELIEKEYSKEAAAFIKSVI